MSTMDRCCFANLFALFRRQMPIKECSSWIYTHHEGLPIVFCPSGKIPIRIYTHHHFAHRLVDFYPSHVYPSENNPSEQIKSGLQTTFQKRAKWILQKSTQGWNFFHWKFRKSSLHVKRLKFIKLTIADYVVLHIFRQPRGKMLQY